MTQLIRMKLLIVFPFIFLFTGLISVAQVDNPRSNIKPNTEGVQEANRFSQLLQEAYRKGDYELQKTYSDSLLLVANLYELRDMSILALNSQAIYYKNKSNREKAIELYRNALQKTENLPNNIGPKAMILANLGNIYTDIGAYKKSIETMDTLLKITDTIRAFSKMKVAALVGLSSNYLKIDQKNKALLFGKEAVELSESMKDSSTLASSLSSLSETYLELNENILTLEVSKRGLTYTHKQNPTKTRGHLLLTNGIAHYNLAQRDEALTSLKQALTLAQNNDIYEIQMGSYNYLSKLYEQNEDFEKSHQAHNEYVRLKNLIKGDEKNATIVDLREDIKINNDSLDKANNKVRTVNKNQKKWFIYGGILITLLTGLLLLFINKKKKADRIVIEFQEKYKQLQKNIKLQSSEDSLNTSSESINRIEVPYEKSALTDADRKRHKQRILSLMRTEKPYLNADLRLADFAKKLSLSPAHISEILHYGFKENFNTFINFYRVTEAQELMKKAENKEAKIISIAFDAGFKSKTTFHRVFKNYTGKTPLEFKKTL